MAMNLRPIKKPIGLPALLSGDQQVRLFRRTFWLGVAVLSVFATLTSQPAWLESDLGGLLIGVAALLPVYMWCSGKVKGVPIYPVYALTFIWTYALPLASNHPLIILYGSDAHLGAAFTVAAFLLLTTAVWAKVARAPARAPKSVRTLDGKAGETFLFIALILSNLFVMASMGGWLDVEAGVFSLLRGVLLSLGSLATFILSYQWGRKELVGFKTKLLIALLLIALVSNIISLFLVGSLSILLLAGIAYTLGRGRVPWKPFFIILVCLVVLHSGKAAMRSKYWGGAEPDATVQPWQYPARIIEWATYSLDYLSQPDPAQSAESRPFMERASLIHLLLMAQEKSPSDVPYMMGATYTIIPQLLVPRFLLPNKPTSHEGTYLLNIHYSLQTREETARTTLGWGLLNEAYANFGFLGCALLAVVIGAAYGWISRWSMHSPVLSARFLFAVLVLSMAFQTEAAASVYLTALFQSAAPLFVLAVVFMKPHKLETASPDVKK